MTFGGLLDESDEGIYKKSRARTNIGKITES